MKSILLIGLGRFGRHIAIKLDELNHQVMAVNLENQEIEVYLIGNFHEDIKTESFLERSKNTSEVIKAYGGKLTGIY